MIEFFTNLINNSSSIELLSFFTVSYLSIELLLSYLKDSSVGNLKMDLINDKTTSWNFFYEMPQFSDNIPYFDNLLFYNVLLGRSLNKRIFQEYKVWRYKTAYDHVKYSKNCNTEWKNIHKDYLNNYPEYFDNYMNLKYYLIYHELEFIRIQMKPKSYYFFFNNDDSIIWKPPIKLTNLTWNSTANEFLLFFDNNIGCSIYVIWFFFIIIFFIIFFKNLAFLQRVKS